ncbi:hypothetical protein Q5425_26830 [Amycolatopsis sp. A133]|uniref:hypothetical protein n=1 Tax=Amycolatopsis sp. A133 TaxID=3064472 RepID=UPI0028005B63|nr:hypothetical protein [Amycolatopsis sp. A133]MDQ7807368.1 hypothetical protein [Amycolatopsis sp. A133]
MHIREEAEKEVKNGKPLNHRFEMSDDALADYLDGFAGRSDGAPLRNGGVGWYDGERGVTVIQRGEFSMSAFKESMADFMKRRG